MHRFLTITFALSCATLFGAAGCSDDDDENNGGTAGTAGASGAGGTSGAAGSAGTSGAAGRGGSSGSGGSGGTSGAAGTSSGDAAGGSGGSGGSAEAAEVVTCPAAADAEIVGGGAPPFSFTPATTTISVGKVIRFRNSSAAPIVHEATSGMGGTTPTPDGKWETGDIAAGASVCMRFNVAGSYPYYCEYHPASMTGTITVQ